LRSPGDYYRIFATSVVMIGHDCSHFMCDCEIGGAFDVQEEKKKIEDIERN